MAEQDYKDVTSKRRRVNDESLPTIRTKSNTLDLRGKNLMTAKQISVDFFAKKMSSKTVFLLHGHGEGGILKTKIRDWLRSEKELVKSFAPASSEDGGDAYTVVRLKSLF